jgi:hypothetical protein
MFTRISRTFRWAPAAGLVSLLGGGVAVTSGCSSDSKPATTSTDAGTGGSSAGGSKSTGGSTSSGGTTSSGGAGGASCASPGGPATDPPDDHCGADSSIVIQETGACVSGTADAGMTMADAGPGEALPGPWGGTSSADDDCKYDVSYTVTPVCENNDVTFTVTLKSRTDHKAVTGASPSLEVLDPTGIPAAEGTQTVTETAGVYKITPIHFNKKGKWTVRFHFFETCSDTPEDSPHGHAAFFITVP